MLVWIADPTFFGRVDRQQAQLERLIAPPSAAEADVAPDLLWAQVATDADGAFRIEGLLSRDYRLRVMDPETLRMVDAGPFRAGGDDALVTFDAPACVLAGRVVSPSGEPIAGARVSAEFHAMQRLVVTRYGGWRTSRRVLGSGCRTDHDGRFVLDNAPTGMPLLRVEGRAVVPTNYRLRGSDDPSRLRIVAGRRCHFRAELDDGPRGDHVALRDAADRPVPLLLFRAGEGAESYSQLPLVDGRSAVMAASDAATTLIVLRGDVEVARCAIVLRPGAVQVVRP